MLEFNVSSAVIKDYLSPWKVELECKALIFSFVWSVLGIKTGESFDGLIVG